LIIFFILIIFVINSEASTKEQVNDCKPIDGGTFKVWLNEVSGFNRNDKVNGYSGVIGEQITSLRIKGEKKYRVHLLGDQEWLPAVNGSDQNEPNNGYAGTVNGRPIDAIVVGGGNKYAVHILGEDWTEPIIEYNITDSKKYAGVIGKPIDAIMIENRVYATSFTSKTYIQPNIKPNVSELCSSSGGVCLLRNDCVGGVIVDGNCTSGNVCCIPKTDEICNARGGKCLVPTSCGDGELLSGYCPGGNNNRCCVTNDGTDVTNVTDEINNTNDTNDDSTFNPVYIIIIVLSVLIVIIIILFFTFSLSKEWITRSITTSIKNIPSINNTNSNISNNNSVISNNYSNSINRDNYNNNGDQPPSYFDVVNEEAMESQGNLLMYNSSFSSSSSSTPIKKSSSNHNQVRIMPNNSSLKSNTYPFVESGSSGSIPAVERSRAVMINLDEPLESKPSIKKKETIPTSSSGSIPPVERSRAVMINLDEPLESKPSIKKRNIPASSVGRPRVMINEPPISRPSVNNGHWNNMGIIPTIERSRGKRVNKMNSLPFEYR